VFFDRESSVSRVKPWRRWREAMFATCTVWLVLQNVALLAVLAWGHPATALAAGTAIATTALALSARLALIVLAVALGFAFAAWLVHAPAETPGHDAPRESMGRGPRADLAPHAPRTSREAETFAEEREVSDVH